MKCYEQPFSFAQSLWLQYFNGYLLRHGIIAEEDWRKMQHLIKQKAKEDT